MKRFIGWFFGGVIVFGILLVAFSILALLIDICCLAYYKDYEWVAMEFVRSVLNIFGWLLTENDTPSLFSGIIGYLLCSGALGCFLSIFLDK